MNDAVNSAEETTSAEESQTLEEKTTGEDFESEDSSSSEDVNTQSNEEEDETVAEALDEVKSPRGENRVQALANDKKRYAEEVKSLREQLEIARRQSIINAPPPQTNEEYLNRQIAIQNQTIQETREEVDWNEAKRSFPELDRGSENYDRDFDDKVYAEYLVKSSSNPSITPKEVAQGFKSYIDRITNKAASRAEGVKQLKRSISTTSSSRTEPDTSSSNELDKAKGRLKNSGSIDDLTEIMKYV